MSSSNKKHLLCGARIKMISLFHSRSAKAVRRSGSESVKSKVAIRIKLIRYSLPMKNQKTI